jgi:hypothetical protein
LVRANQFAVRHLLGELCDYEPVLGVDKGNEEVTGGSKAVRDVVWEVEAEAKMVSKLSNAVVDL